MTNKRIKEVLTKHDLYEEGYTVEKFLTDVKEEYATENYYTNVKDFITESLFWNNTEIEGTEEVINWLCENISDNKEEVIKELKIIKVSEVLEACKNYNFDVNDIADMLEVADGLFAYPEENGDGYILDAEDFKGMLLNDTTTHCQVTNCYYWRNENNKIQIEAIDFKNDPDQHKRQVEAGHHVIYDTMYLIAPYFKTYFGEL